MLRFVNLVCLLCLLCVGCTAPRHYFFEGYDDNDSASKRMPRHPVFSGMFSFAPGNATYDADFDGGSDDDTDAGFIRAQFEGIAPSGSGGGIAVEYSNSDDDLFTDTEATVLDFFPYYVSRVTGGSRFRMPIRIGPYLNLIEQEATATETDWGAIGLRVGFEPEVVAIRARNLEWSMYGGFGAGFHLGRIDSDAPDDRFLAGGYTFNGEVGSRMRFGPVSVGIAYIYRWIHYNESEEEEIGLADVEFPETDHVVDGVVVMIGARF